MIALGYKDTAEVVAKIDGIVIERRRANPAVTFSRAAFLREAVNRALAEVEVPPTKTSVRASAPALPPLPGADRCPAR